MPEIITKRISAIRLFGILNRIERRACCAITHRVHMNLKSHRVIAQDPLSQFFA